jgi:hypothetical protein
MRRETGQHSLSLLVLVTVHVGVGGTGGTGYNLADAQGGDEGDSRELHCDVGEDG